MADVAEKKAKRGFFKSVVTYFKGIKSEFKKVVWPNKKQIINNTAIVLLAILIIGGVVVLLDLFFGWGLSLIIKR